MVRTTISPIRVPALEEINTSACLNIGAGKDNDEISRLVLECKTKLVISCAYPGNYFLFPNEVIL